MVFVGFPTKDASPKLKDIINKKPTARILSHAETFGSVCGLVDATVYTKDIAE